MHNNYCDVTYNECGESDDTDDDGSDEDNYGGEVNVDDDDDNTVTFKSSLFIVLFVLFSRFW